MRVLKSLFNVSNSEGNFYWLIWVATFLSCFGKVIFDLDIVADFLLTGVMCLTILVAVVHDRRWLRKHYYRPPSLGWVFITPIYLFRRDHYTDKPDSRLSLAYVLMIIIGLGLNMYLGRQASNDLKNQACALINTVNLSSTYDLKCLAITDFHRTGGMTYRGEVINNFSLPDVDVVVVVADSGLITDIKLEGVDQ